MANKIINTLCEYQGSHDLSDLQFVGKDANLWSHIKGGRKLPNEKFLIRVGNIYPELIPALFEHFFPGFEIPQPDETQLAVEGNNIPSGKPFIAVVRPGSIISEYKPMAEAGIK